ncbi:GntR family transcriptional regulator [Limnoglobus roseus]|uniref:GntR family transcriptional regulator n=1 Tax=Limnoglobus roseus TaxID=2598579 RepID=A0A5C1AEH5_9BACT|nr:GntR family transcriptional regulator [Limnoglobus roseus]QEL17130.1 GntR family transcriptional regulator [Limnoglobus roseus]
MKEVKYRKIVAYLRSAIQAGRYKDGQRLPSEAALVRQFAASRPTVIRALRELQAEGLIDRRVGSGTFVRAGDRLASPAGRTFGLLVPGLADGEIFEPVCVALARHAQSLGHTLLWGDLPGEPGVALEAPTLRLCEGYVRAGVAGVIFSPLEFSSDKDKASRRIVRMLDEAKIPIVLLDRDFVEPPARSSYDLVGVDNHRAGYLLARHLLTLGNRVIHFLGRHGSAPTVRTRVAGYQAALWEHGVTPDAGWVHWGDAGDLPFVRRWMRRGRPDAVVCANDKTAALLMQTLAALRLGVPRDVRVVGVDDLRYAKLLRPALTTVHQPCQLLAAVAMHTLIERLANPSLPPRHVMLAGELVVRQSCGTPAAYST